jgi:hypothetical protein
LNFSPQNLTVRYTPSNADKVKKLTSDKRMATPTKIRIKTKRGNPVVKTVDYVPISHTIDQNDSYFNNLCEPETEQIQKPKIFNFNLN